MKRNIVYIVLYCDEWKAVEACEIAWLWNNGSWHTNDKKQEMKKLSYVSDSWMKPKLVRYILFQNKKTAKSSYTRKFFLLQVCSWTEENQNTFSTPRDILQGKPNPFPTTINLNAHMSNDEGYTLTMVLCSFNKPLRSGLRYSISIYQKIWKTDGNSRFDTTVPRMFWKEKRNVAYVSPLLLEILLVPRYRTNFKSILMCVFSYFTTIQEF